MTYEQVKEAVSRDRDGDTGIKRGLKALIAPTGLLTGCGARELSDTASGAMAGIVKEKMNEAPGVPMWDKRFDGTTSNQELVQEFINDAKDRGVWNRNHDSLPQNVHVVDDIPEREDGSKPVAYMESIRGIGSLDHIGPLPIQNQHTRFVMSKLVDMLPKEAKRRIVAHELGHGIYNEDDIYGDGDKDDLMYGYSYPRDDEWKSEQKEAYIKKMIRDFLDRQKGR